MAKIIAKTEITISRIVDIKSVTRYYLLQSSTAAAPSKPTTNPPGGSWQTTEPSYVSGSTNTLYFTDCTVMTNGTFSYSAISKSSSYEAAKEAWNKANNAQESIDNLEIGGRNLIIGSSVGSTNEWTKTGWNGGSFISEQSEEHAYRISAYEGWMVLYYVGLADYIGKTVTLHMYAKNIKDETTANDSYALTFSNNTSIGYYTEKLTSDKPIQDEWIEITKKFVVNTSGHFGIGAACEKEGKGYKSTWILKNLKLELGNKATDWTPAPEDVDGAINDVIGSYQKDLLDQRTEILKEVDEIVLTAGADYVVKDDYSKYQETVESKFTQMEDGIKMDFSTSREQLNELNKALADTKTEWAKYIRFNEDGIEIGDTDNSLKLEIDNDMIRFTKNGITTGWWDGNNFHTGNIVVEVNERAQFGNFAFVPRSDGSLSFLKVGD